VFKVKKDVGFEPKNSDNNVQHIEAKTKSETAYYHRLSLDFFFFSSLPWRLFAIRNFLI